MNALDEKLSIGRNTISSVRVLLGLAVGGHLNVQYCEIPIERVWGFESQAKTVCLAAISK